MISIADPFAATQSHSLQALRRRTAGRLIRMLFGPGSDRPDVELLPSVGIHRILVCHVSHTLGNTLLLTPLLCELQRVYPGAEVDVVTRSPAAAAIFSAFACVRHVHCLPAHALRTPWRVARVARALRSRRYDLAIDPCLRSQSDRVGVLIANAARTLGYVTSGKSGVLSHGIAAPACIRRVGQVPVYLLRRATGHFVDAAYPSPDIGLTDMERARGIEALTRLLGCEGTALSPVIGVFANATGPKQLGTDWWLRFVRQLSGRSTGIRIIEIVPVAGASLLNDRYPAFYSSDLRRLASVLSALSLHVSADCGVMHLACAAGVPTVGLFSVTDPGQWGPYGPRDAVIDIGVLTPEQAADAVAIPACDNRSPRQAAPATG